MLYDSDELLVEENLVDGQYYFRKLVLKQCYNLTQSQYRLTYYNQKNEEKSYLHGLNQKIQSIVPSKKNMVIGIDDGYLDFEVHRSMIASMSLMQTQNKPIDVLILGGGLCCLGKFIESHFSQCSVTSVEISPQVIKLAEELFEVHQSNSFRLVEADALEFVKSQVAKLDRRGADQQEEQKSDESVSKYDMVVVDIDNNSFEVCPPPQFLTHEFLTNLKCLLKSSSSIVAINSICYNPE